MEQLPGDGATANERTPLLSSTGAAGASAAAISASSNRVDSRHDQVLSATDVAGRVRVSSLQRQVGLVLAIISFFSTHPDLNKLWWDRVRTLKFAGTVLLIVASAIISLVIGSR